MLHLQAQTRWAFSTKDCHQATDDATLFDLAAYVKSQFAATHSSESEVRIESIAPEVPTLLQSLPQKQVKFANLDVSASIPSVAHDPFKDVEAGITLPSTSVAEVELQEEVDPSGGTVPDVVQWLTNVDITSLKIPAIPAGVEAEVCDSQV